MNWNKIEQRIKAEFGEDLYSSWFARIELEQIEDATLTVSVPTRFLRNWIEAHYRDRLIRICETEFGTLENFVIKVRTRGLPLHPTADTDKVNTANQLKTPQPRFGERASNTAPRSPEQGSPIDPLLTFNSFVTGKSNALAHAAAKRIADSPVGAPVSFNPLFIHAPAGLGKTHLLNSIAWQIREEAPERNVLYITAERFMYHFIKALKSRDVLPFKDFFQTVDVLLVDDFQFLQGKTMQQEFCHTFASLLDSKRQVVVAADSPPSQLSSIDQRMRSRFAGGLVVDIQVPDIDLRRDILNARLRNAQSKIPNLAISSDVIEFIANRVTSGGRELEGALNRMIHRQQANRITITVDLAALELRDLSENAEPPRIRIDDILQAIGRHYSVSRSDLLSARRARSIVHPRQIGMYLAKKLTPRSLPDIGRRFGGKDHSTVLHAVRKIDRLMKSDDAVARDIVLLTRLLEQNPDDS